MYKLTELDNASIRFFTPFYSAHDTSCFPGDPSQTTQGRGARSPSCGARTHGSGLFLDIAISEFKKGAQPLEREVAGGEVHGDEPGGDEVDEVVQEVGVGDAVDGGVEGEGEEEGGG